MRLLILACSATKRRDVGLMPAWLRYDGPAWRTLRAAIFAPDGPGLTLDIYALSAEHGLIPAIQPIADYDRALDPLRALALRGATAAAWRRACAHAAHTTGGYAATLIAGGALYQQLLPDPPPPGAGRLTRTGGPIGAQLQQLRAWLHQGQP